MGCCVTKNKSREGSVFASKIGFQTLSDFQLSKELEIKITFSAKNRSTMLIMSMEIRWDGVKQVDLHIEPHMEIKFNGSSKQIMGNFESESQTYNGIEYKLKFSLTTKQNMKYIHISGTIGNEKIPKTYKQEFVWSFAKNTKRMLMA